jgi:aprataxin
VAYPVKLPSDCPLTLSEGIHQVINLVGPNFNPNRPDPIEDKMKGLALLRQTYEELFKCFFKLTNLPPTASASTINVSGQKMSGEGSLSSSNAPSGKGGWGNALYAYVDHPEKQGSSVFHYDTETVTIYDKYPKAKKHFLVMPRAHIESINALKPSDIPVLEAMKKRAEAVIEV